MSTLIRKKVQNPETKRIKELVNWRWKPWQPIHDDAVTLVTSARALRSWQIRYDWQHKRNNFATSRMPAEERRIEIGRKQIMYDCVQALGRFNAIEFTEFNGVKHVRLKQRRAYSWTDVNGILHSGEFVIAYDNVQMQCLGCGEVLITTSGKAILELESALFALDRHKTAHPPVE